jgi:hypothetical protein
MLEEKKKEFIRKRLSRKRRKLVQQNKRTKTAEGIKRGEV